MNWRVLGRYPADLIRNVVHLVRDHRNPLDRAADVSRPDA